MKAIAVTSLAVLALAAGGVWLLRAPSAGGDVAPVALTVAGVPLWVEPQLARAPADLGNRALEELDLVASLPDVSPVGDKANAMPLETLVFLTLRRIDEKIEPRDKPTRLYARFLDSSVEAHPAGLILRRFEPGSPYDKETLYMTPPEGRVFWARCTPASTASSTPATCLSEARLGGFDIRLRFAPEALGEWEALTAGVVRLVEGMRR